MGVSIKNPETERLIRELAEMTGEGKTEAVDVAVRERIARVTAAKASHRRVRRMREIVDELAPLLADMPDIDTYLYDQTTGLPK